MLHATRVVDSCLARLDCDKHLCFGVVLYERADETGRNSIDVVKLGPASHRRQNVCAHDY